MKIDYLIVTIFAVFLFLQGTAQTEKAKIKLKPATMEQDSALETWPVLVSVAEKNDFKSPEIQKSFEKYSINFFPESDKGVIYIQFNDLDNNIKPELLFCNEKGDVIYKILAKTRLNVINLRKTPSGTYLITVDVNGEISTWEIVKE